MKGRLPGTSRMYEETKRVSRLLELTSLLSRHPKRYLRRDLADRFEVSERMIQKDLDVLRNGLKFDLAHSSQGYYFEKAPQLPALQYTFAEALSLWLAVQASRHVSGVDSSELSAAVARLEALFPTDFSRLLQLSGGRPFTGGGHRQEALSVLAMALMQGRKVRILYETRSRDGELNDRVIRPYHLMAYVRSWHLIGHCEKRDSVRTFKVDRIRDITLLDERYAIPPDFNVDDYLGMAWGVMRGGEEAVEEVVLRFDSQAGHWVSEERWHRSQSVEELPDGRILFRLTVVPTPEFVNWLLYYGSRVEVIEPAWLRDRVAEEHRRAFQVYGGREAEAK